MRSHEESAANWESVTAGGAGTAGPGENGQAIGPNERRPARSMRSGRASWCPVGRDRSGQLPAGVTYTMAYELSFAAFLMTIETP
ncbi:hypothetical protein GA0070609_6267 [Micromonospora echinaurantiaca]|uniref:Uncharacterized protein n=1 Tax=Micromonospora echinaurantiaca TaxID=47857 RepID=A0A1C5KBE7_9ACTN|nr:hypothetical protein GA0070609_6267 [Micromonospora echinaurantiaca]